MSLIALIATSVSAYAVSSTSFASGACALGLLEQLDARSSRASAGRRRSTPPAGCAARTWSSTASAWAPDVARTIRYSAPYWLRRSREIACETIGIVVDGQDRGFAHRSASGRLRCCADASLGATDPPGQRSAPGTVVAVSGQNHGGASD